MSQELINVGVQPNNGDGDPLRTAFTKTNNNFSQLFEARTQTLTSYSIGLDTNQLLFETTIDRFTQAQYQIRSSIPITNNLQSVIISATITNNQANVIFTSFASMTEGTPICNYTMDILGDKVRLLVNPLVDTTLTHFVAASITYQNEFVPGVRIGANGYPPGTVLGTQGEIDLTTEQV